jgi:hypothetical protein
MLQILWPTLIAAGVPITCAAIWVTRPTLQANKVLRLALIVSTIGTVAPGLVAGVEIIGRVMAFGLEDAF